MSNSGSGTDPLPTYNPWPDDPAFYDGVISRLSAREDAANQVRSGIQGLIGDPALCQWLGASADAFKGTLEPVPTLLARMVAAYGSAADAVKTFVGQVRAGQAEWTKLQNDLQAKAVAHPDLVDGFFGLKRQLEMFAHDASAAHDTAMKTASGIVDEAAMELSNVSNALGDKRYADFNATFTKLGGDLSNLSGLEYMGNDVLPTTVDPEKLIQSIAWMNQHLGDNGGGLMAGFGAMEYYGQIKDMSPAELDALMAMMTPAERQALNAALGKISNADRVKWTNLVLTNSSQSTLDVVQQDMPNVEPDWHNDEIKKGLVWAASDKPLFGPRGVNIENDLKQGDDGDCWFLSSAAAVAERDPTFFQNHITENPNGTYSVTFYDNGHPTQVTVDGRLPTYSGTNNQAYAQVGDTKWVAIYEKAYAQYKGGYGPIEGGYGDVGLHDITGQSTQRLDPIFSSFSQINTMIDHGQAVTIGTRKDNGFLGWGADGEYIDNGKLVSAHEYSVESVNMNAHPPTITLLNPWGTCAQNDHGGAIGKVTLTESEWRTYCSEIGMTAVHP